MIFSFSWVLAKVGQHSKRLLTEHLIFENKNQNFFHRHKNELALGMKVMGQSTSRERAVSKNEANNAVVVLSNDLILDMLFKYLPNEDKMKVASLCQDFYNAANEQLFGYGEDQLYHFFARAVTNYHGTEMNDGHLEPIYKRVAEKLGLEQQVSVGSYGARKNLVPYQRCRVLFPLLCMIHIGGTMFQNRESGSLEMQQMLDITTWKEVGQSCIQSLGENSTTFQVGNVFIVIRKIANNVTVTIENKDAKIISLQDWMQLFKHLH